MECVEEEVEAETEEEEDPGLCLLFQEHYAGLLQGGLHYSLGASQTLLFRTLCDRAALLPSTSARPVLR